MTNWGYLGIAAAGFVAFSTVPIRGFLLSKARGGKDAFVKNNINPRNVAEDLYSKGKLTAEQYERIQRLVACQANGWENLPVFAAGVLAANQAGLEQSFITQMAAVYVACRVVFTGSYIAGTPLTGTIRSLAYVGGMGVSFAMLICSALK